MEAVQPRGSKGPNNNSERFFKEGVGFLYEFLEEGVGFLEEFLEGGLGFL